MIMKKTNFLYASAIMMAMACGVVSCTTEDNPAPSPKEPVYEAVFTYDFAAEQALIAAGVVEKPGNFNGNQDKKAAPCLMYALFGVVQIALTRMLLGMLLVV